MAKNTEVNNQIVLVGEEALKNKIYIVRGVKVMLDTDLAEIYGYTTKAFNQQVKNNIRRFPEDFRFQLTEEEANELSRSNFLTSMQTTGTKGGRVYLPYVFTEQGIYMLMTVLKGELAIEQSKNLIRLFKSMKDYIIENQQIMIEQKDYINLVHRIERNSNDILRIKETLGNTVTKTELSDFMRLFETSRKAEEILILDGQPFKADLAYQKIYEIAEKNIIVIDDYIGLKTLQHLASAKVNIAITIISDNKGSHPLRKTEYDDYREEYPYVDISFLTSAGKVHDRYIILDHNTPTIRVYHCGSSSKDAGKRITTITEIKDITYYENVIQALLTNSVLILR